jgi:hypothetical protein
MPKPCVPARGEAMPAAEPLSTYIRDPFVRRAFRRAGPAEELEISPLLKAGTRIVCVDTYLDSAQPGSNDLRIEEGAIYTIRDFHQSRKYGVILVRLSEVVRDRDQDDGTELGFYRWRFRVLNSINESRKSARRIRKPRSVAIKALALGGLA